MSAVAPSILLVLEDGIDAAPIEDALAPGSRVTRARLAESGYGPAAAVDAAADAALVIVGCGSRHDLAIDVVERATQQRVDRPPVVVLHRGSPNGFLERAFAAGADDLITLPQPPAELAFALQKALARRRGAVPQTRRGTMITVLGPKGGTGKTLTTCNLAVALALDGHSPVVVDLDLQFGDVGLALGLRPHRTIYDLAVSGGSLDAEKLDGFLARHDSGASALLAPVRPDQAAAISTPFLRDVFEALRARHDFVVVDTPPAFTPEVIAAIDSSTSLCMVGMLDALSLKDTKIGLETLAQMGYDPADVMLVLNRADTSVGISRDDVERLLGRRPDVLVPSDRAIPRAITDGRTIVAAEPRSGAARAFSSLAATYAGGASPQDVVTERPDRRRRSLLRKEAF